MVMRGSFGIKDKKVEVTCPVCQHRFNELILVVETEKVVECPNCGHAFEPEP